MGPTSSPSIMVFGVERLELSLSKRNIKSLQVRGLSQSVCLLTILRACIFVDHLNLHVCGPFLESPCSWTISICVFVDHPQFANFEGDLIIVSGWEERVPIFTAKRGYLIALSDLMFNWVYVQLGIWKMRTGKHGTASMDKFSG